MVPKLWLQSEDHLWMVLDEAKVKCKLKKHLTQKCTCQSVSVFWNVGAS